MDKKANVISLTQTGGSASDELDALNTETRRKVGVVPMIEATIEATARKRRRQETPSSTASKKV